MNYKSFILKTAFICLALISLIGLSRCANPKPERINTSIQDSIHGSDTFEFTQMPDSLKDMMLRAKPIWGYRFKLAGDFDGDGKQDTLYEKYFSTITKKEINKYYDSIADYSNLVDITIYKSPISFMIDKQHKLDTLLITINPQQFGVSFLKNEGDLNGDGTDEISYVVNWADYSSINTWHIVTFKNNKWQELYGFPIWDWQLPDTPQTANEYGLFGQTNKVALNTNDSLNSAINEQYQAFPGLVKKLGNQKIQVIFKNEEASEDTMIVDLKNLPK